MQIQINKNNRNSTTTRQTRVFYNLDNLNLHGLLRNILHIEIDVSDPIPIFESLIGYRMQKGSKLHSSWSYCAALIWEILSKLVNAGDEKKISGNPFEEWYLSDGLIAG